MRVRYDDEVDAAYIHLSTIETKGAIEIKEGVTVHVSGGDEIVGIEILNASARFPIRTLHTLRFVSG